ncbi:PilW family protein [Psychrobacter pygoscelis]|uniref:PilW family protein n=1 Tax=Psychrobacter pygoscelis TaxID=2488563 RepID=UPI00103AC50C|nr:PilW family protein [Psychrobacter pygoscelis]
MSKIYPRAQSKLSDKAFSEKKNLVVNSEPLQLISPSYRLRQQGFTLVELMVSLVLGLLISAAVIQVFITSQRVDRIQAGGSDIQDKAIFGVQAITRKLRLANLGNEGREINDTTPQGGIVLTAGDATATNVNVAITNGLKNGYLTRSNDMATEGRNRWNGTLTNTSVPSDQLTIQYVNATNERLFDCEGTEVAVDDRVIERYYLKEGTATNAARKNLNLVCDAGRIEAGTLTNFGETSRNRSAVLIENVDQFNIRLGVQRLVPSTGTPTYEHAEMTVKDYMGLSGQKPYITSVRFAILARSTANSPEDSSNTFKILGSDQSLKAQANAPKYLRRVYESTVLLRNARVVRVIDSATSSGSSAASSSSSAASSGNTGSGGSVGDDAGSSQ